MKAKVLAGAVVCGCVLLFSGVLPSWGFEIKHKGKTYQFGGETIGGENYLALEDIVSILGGSTAFDSKTKRYTLRLKARSFQFVPDNPFACVNDSLVNLPIPPRLHKGELLLPIPILNTLFGASTGQDFRWDPKRKVLTIGPKLKAHTIAAIGIATSPTLTQITVETADPLGFEFRIDGSTLILDIEKGILPAGLAADKPDGLVKKITHEQLKDIARITFTLTPDFGKIDTLSLKRPSAILLFLSKKMKRKPPKKEVKLNRILVDPGHGGKDPGAVGRRKLLEKEVNLDIAKALKEKLEKLGVEVLLTRKDDSYVSLTERVGMANRDSCHLFVSIHCNSAKNKEGGGCETYFLSEAKTDWARAVEARENAAIRFELPDPSFEEFDAVSSILWDMAQNEYLNESSNLAECVQVELAKKLPIRDRGVQQAGFYVLAGAYMPAILVEVAFLSNREEEKLLRKSWFKKRVVEGIYLGVRRFKESYERKLSQ